MFENVPSIPRAFGAEFTLAPTGGITVVDDSEIRAGDALRAIGWSELTARINAARDLREVMRRDAMHGSINVASFGDAAASYFAALGESERPVNPIALEGRKASAVISSLAENDVVKGDRETTYD